MQLITGRQVFARRASRAEANSSTKRAFLRKVRTVMANPRRVVTGEIRRAAATDGVPVAKRACGGGFWGRPSMPLLAAVLLVVMLLLVSAATAGAEPCVPYHPSQSPEVCPGLTTIHKPHMRFLWGGLDGTIEVDIVQKSFNNKACDNCPYANCAGCWNVAIRQNAIAGWNDAHRAIFGWDKWVEVPGHPYDHKFHMYTPQQTLDTFSERQARRTAFTDLRPYGLHTICPESEEACEVLVFGPTRTYVNYSVHDRRTRQWYRVPWRIDGGTTFNARRTATHELGHSVILGDVLGVGFETVMDYLQYHEWPALGDGQALACMYYRPYRCAGCQLTP